MIKEKFHLSNKVALVVGGRGLLGQRFAAALAEYGAKVYAADLPQLSPAARKSKASNAVVKIIQKSVDVTKKESVEKLIQNILKETSKIDILIYSVTAKSPDFYKPFTESSLEGWQTVLRAELDGLFLVSQSVGKFMESVKHGSIIFISSVYGIVGNDQRIYENTNLAKLYADSKEKKPKRIFSAAVYAAAKGAVISMTRFLAAYWEGTNIRVNCISPGGISHSGEDKKFVKRYSERVPLKRKADIDDISGAVIYLASDASSYVTGHNLVVDGGWTAW